MPKYLERILVAGVQEKWWKQGFGDRWPETTLGYDMQQNPAELAQFFEWIAEMGFRSYLEVGVRTGGLWTLATEMFGFSPSCAIDYKPHVVRFQPDNGQLFIGDCRAKKSVAWAAARGPYDLVLIDASHDYESAKADYRNYRDMARYIAFHDIFIIRDVARLWGQLTGKVHPVFVAAGGSKAVGIGVLEGEVGR